MFSLAGMLRMIRALLYVGARNFYPLRKHTVLLQSGAGKGFYGNPYYLAEHILANPDYARYRVICVSESSASIPAGLRATRLEVCKVGSFSYILNLATAKYVINDTSFPVWFVRRVSQCYLNTWHGTPLKTLGKRAAVGVHANLRNMQRNFFQCTDILTPNAHTLKVLRDDFMLPGIWSGRFIEKGYPRNDVLFRSGKKAGDIGHVVFMPTWRGTHADPKAYSEDIQGFLDILVEGLPRSIVWVRLHPLAEGNVSIRYDERIRAFPVDSEPYEHLAECDALITDYSSVMFDFAITRRPVILYVPDMDGYREERDFCLDIDLLPFPVLTDGQAVVEALKGSRLAVEQEEAFRTLIRSESGNSARDVCMAFFNEPNLEARPEREQRMALFLLPMGEPQAAILMNCAQKLCRDGWQVTLCVEERHDKAEALRLCREEAGCSFIPATEDRGMLVWQRLLHSFLQSFSSSVARRFRQRWRVQEWRRLFGHNYCPRVVVAADEGVGGRMFSPLHLQSRYVFVRASQGEEYLEQAACVIEFGESEGGEVCRRVYGAVIAAAGESGVSDKCVVQD